MYIYAYEVERYTKMKTKNARLKAIRKLLETQKISNQEELRQQLADMGFDTTQATLSRDLTALRVVKIVDPDKGYIYTLSNQAVQAYSGVEENAPLQAFRSIAFSQNIAVIKCLPSFAPSIAFILDRLQLDVSIGTIAGDDTIMLIMREGVTAPQFKEALLQYLPDLRERV